MSWNEWEINDLVCFKKGGLFGLGALPFNKTLSNNKAKVFQLCKSYIWRWWWWHDIVYQFHIQQIEGGHVDLLLLRHVVHKTLFLEWNDWNELLRWDLAIILFASTESHFLGRNQYLMGRWVTSIFASAFSSFLH